MGDFLKRWLQKHTSNSTTELKRSSSLSKRLSTIPIRDTIISRRLSLYTKTVDNWNGKIPTTVEEFQVQMTRLYSLAFHVAARSGNLSKVKKIVGKVNEASFASAIPNLTIQGDIVIKFLVDHKDPADGGRTSLQQAAQCGNLQLFRYLVEECKADVFARDNIHESQALHLACQSGHLEIVSYLLQWNGHLLEEKDKLNCTPLNIACLAGHLSVVEFLVLKCLANVENKTLPYGDTPLLQAARKGHLDVVKFLADKTDMSARTSGNDQMSDTAIHLAASFGHTEVVDFLIATCPELIDSVNDIGLTPYGYATLANQWAVARLIEKRSTYGFS